jgi:protein SCO1/2
MSKTWAFDVQKVFNDSIMKYIYYFIFLLICSSTFISCDKKTNKDTYHCAMKCQGDTVYNHAGKCPVCNMDLILLDTISGSTNKQDTVNYDSISELSVFNITSNWTDQHNQSHVLEDFKGKVLIVTMIYTSCEASCPRMVSDVRAIHDSLNNKNIQYVFVSMDPEKDTPERLKAYAKENKMTAPEYVFLQGSEDDVRELSNILNVKYKRTSEKDFSHSNLISVFDKNGVLQFQQEGLGVDNATLRMKVKELL